ncbi:DUF6262 family protein [Rhodococcus sp. NPDC057529]|uniref:DUF6262 family protein n=1 Tax=Rhodococcus sp. NPDC057529 TaxID=3346158 RepID=UPI00366C3DAA
MRADNRHHIHQAAQRRHELTRSKAVAALRKLENEGSPVTFEAVATEARVSRSWLYTQPDLREEIIRLRSEGRRDRPPVRTRDRATTDSLHTRLAVAHNRIRALTEENASLRHQLALALGHARASRTNLRTTPT